MHRDPDDWLTAYHGTLPDLTLGDHLRYLVLDDDPARVRSFRLALGNHMLHVHSSRDCIRALETHPFQIAFLDHDLEMSVFHYGCTGHGSGTHVVTHLWEQRNVAAQTLFVVHSMNDECAPLMVRTLRDCGRRATQRAQAWRDQADLQAIVAGAPWDVTKERAVTLDWS